MKNKKLTHSKKNQQKPKIKSQKQNKSKTKKDEILNEFKKTSENIQNS